MTVSIPMARYVVGDTVEQEHKRPGPANRHRHKVISVRPASEGYDRVRVLCETCGATWSFVHHWGRWL